MQHNRTVLETESNTGRLPFRYENDLILPIKIDSGYSPRFPVWGLAKGKGCFGGYTPIVRVY